MTWRGRKRPVWLRVVALVLLWPTLLGLFVWMLDLNRHPHDSTVTRWAVLRQQGAKRADSA